MSPCSSSLLAITTISLSLITSNQGGRSWRASGDRQISLNACAERAFANFRDKKHRILQLQIFATKTSFYNCKRLQPCARVASPALTLVPLR